MLHSLLNSLLMKGEAILSLVWEVTIPIVDDDINEANEQVFIIFLEVINVTNLDNFLKIDTLV